MLLPTTLISSDASVDYSNPLSQSEVDSICRTASRAITNMQLIMPYFQDLLKERQPLPDSPQAVREREAHFALFDGLVGRFRGMHEQHCGSLGDGDIASNTAKKFRDHDQPERPAVAAIGTTTTTTKTYKDFEPFLLAMPFHNLLELFMKREVALARTENEYFRREGEMAAYVEQVKEHGLAGGKVLKEPRAYWAERVEESGLWNESEGSKQ